jgi:hypothetical protein
MSFTLWRMPSTTQGLKATSLCWSHCLPSLPPSVNTEHSLMHFMKDCESRQSLLRGDNRPTEEDMMTQLESDAELIHQQV